ncbi:hypothetical protein ElyMa_004642000 [Elysia marginata]|uniref:Uncharacterized protein n=1 Tax=Elysia marginata TaxID=1093978 RepID=A0AAV4I587_9GAST|nr:hypothetical protein ElyMa_004642000 [Elysia marginata]
MLMAWGGGWGKRTLMACGGGWEKRTCIDRDAFTVFTVHRQPSPADPPWLPPPADRFTPALPCLYLLLLASVVCAFSDLIVLGSLSAVSRGGAGVHLPRSTVSYRTTARSGSRRS